MSIVSTGKSGLVAIEPEILMEAKGMRIVQDQADLQQAVEAILTDPAGAAELGERAYRVIQGHQGATQRMTDLILRKYQSCFS